VALTFLVYGAPDLAMTQFMTETLTVILFVFVFYHLPRFGRLSSRLARWRDLAIAAAFGTMMTALVLAATAIPLDSSLQEFYAQNSRPLGHGRNVVNVILVDFRALDTLGEITVLSVAAIGVFALLRLRPRKDRA
jgi:multicomponent Na+:H+ antiporter subunit A